MRTLSIHLFENGVILYGSKTQEISIKEWWAFENGVILYGSKTYLFGYFRCYTFENGVILYGSKTTNLLVA